jgi:hypothetical protein
LLPRKRRRRFRGDLDYVFVILSVIEGSLYNDERLFASLKTTINDFGSGGGTRTRKEI